MQEDESVEIEEKRRRGRAALSNHAARFEPVREEIDDGWDLPEERGVFRTEVAVERPRSVITRNSSPDVAIGSLRQAIAGL